ncbi:hypothetical protein EIMP300_06420 [Escherichia coli]|uniref:N-acetyltransferase domain-containing protein n=1 Tax=Escherichia coli TaxID=562 RepID=A0A8S0FD16_ECOLX|nr:hypothetical protein EIMP300_06420 [Escherichia coli]
MAVHPDVQDKGLGTLMAMTLESVARQEGVKRVTCSAREDAVEFFAKLGFVNQGEITTPTTTPIRHFLMIKPVATLDDILHRGDWCAQLQQAWYEHIPLSEKMGVRIQQYTGQKFITTMPETGNQNPHHTLFAGSLFSLATLAGRIRRAKLIAQSGRHRLGAYLADAARTPPRRNDYSGGCAYPLQQAD